MHEGLPHNQTVFVLNFGGNGPEMNGNLIIRIIGQFDEMQ